MKKKDREEDPCEKQITCRYEDRPSQAKVAWTGGDLKSVSGPVPERGRDSFTLLYVRLRTALDTRNLVRGKEKRGYSFYYLQLLGITSRRSTGSPEGDIGTATSVVYGGRVAEA